MSDVNTSVQKAIAHNVCGAPPVKLSKVDWKPYALIKKILQVEQKVGQGKHRDERLERHRGDDSGHGTVLRGVKNPMSITAAKVRAP